MSVRKTKQCQTPATDTLTGHACKNRTSTDSRCWVHMRKLDHLRVKPSPIAGKGLFADGNPPPRNPPNVVFKKGQNVYTYE